MLRELGSNRTDEELYGNNAAFTCPKCGRVFIVSALLNEVGGPRGERKYPGCRLSVARLRDKVATIEWQE